MNREREIIALLSQNSERNGDDAAWIPSEEFAGKKILMATDSLVEGVHFNHNWSSPGQVAGKLYEMNASDIFVKGGAPRYALLNASLRPETALNSAWMNSFSQALNKNFERDGVGLIGGDTTRSSVDIFSLTLIGAAGNFISRRAQTLKSGDLIVVDGLVGGSEWGYRFLSSGGDHRDERVLPHLHPRARHNSGWLSLAVASIDQSDSLSETFEILAAENQTSLRVDLARLPVPAHLEQMSRAEKISLLFNAAEDFAAVAIVPSEKREQLPVRSDFAVIGEVLSAGRSVEYFWEDEKLEKSGSSSYRHFE